MDEIRRKYGDASMLPPAGEITLPAIEEESQEELYDMWLDDSEDLSGFDEGT